MCQCHTHLWNDLLVAYSESYWIRASSGRRLTSRTSCGIISAILTNTGLILGGMVPPRLSQTAIRSLTSSNTAGKNIVVAGIHDILIQDVSQVGVGEGSIVTVCVAYARGM